MRHHITKTATMAIALLLSAGLACAADKKAEAPGATAASAKAGEKNAKDKKPAASAKSKAAVEAKVKPVDINSASKAELMKLPGIGAAQADQIIAGRPYNTKARLVTKKIISVEVWDNISRLIEAKQK